jgi:integrase
VTWKLGGRTGRKQSCTFATKELADAANALCRSRRHKITDAEVYTAIHGLSDDDVSDVPTLSDFAQTWIADRRRNRAAGKTYLDRQAWIIEERIEPRLGKLRVVDEQITPDVVTEWVGWLKSQPGPTGFLKASTVREAHVVLHGLLQAAVPRRLSFNPAAVRQTGSRRKSGLPQVEPYDATFLTPGEIDLIVDACGPHIRDMVIVSLLTGLRLGELLVLRVEDVTLTGRRKIIRVRQALKKTGTIGPPKSRRSRRDIGISARVAKVLMARVKGRPRHALIFTAPRGRCWSPTNLRKRYWLPAVAHAQRCKKHPPPLPPKPSRGPRRNWRVDEVSTCDCATRLHRTPRWHDLRHTHVSLCVEDGWDITRVSRRVGHDSITTTINIYGHLWDPDGDERVDQLDRYVLQVEDEEA